MGASDSTTKSGPLDSHTTRDRALERERRGLPDAMEEEKVGKPTHGADLAGSGRRGDADGDSSRAGQLAALGLGGASEKNGDFHSTLTHITPGNAKR